MLLRYACFICLTIVCGLSIQAQAVHDLTLDGHVAAENAKALLGQPAVVQLMSGVVISDTQILDFIQDRKTGSIQFVQYKDGVRKPKRKANDVYRMLIAGKPYRLRYNGPTRGYYLIDINKAISDAEARVSAQNRGFREPQSQEEIEEAVTEQKVFFNDAIKKLGNPRVRQYESNFSIVLSDYPEPAARELNRYIDQTCEQLNAMFGIPAGSNIWHGKVLIAVFAQRQTFADFESNVLNNKNFGTATTIYHTSSRRFLVACFRDKMSKSLAKTLCWGVGGGYVGQYRSSVRIAEWMRVGLRETVTEAMFPDPRKLASIKRTASSQLKRTSSLLGLLSATSIDNDEREWMAKLLVMFLINQSPQAFSQMFEDVKLCHTWEASLKTNFGATPEQFAASFGKSLGVPGLTL